MRIAGRITALALMDGAASALVLRIPYAWSWILLAIAYLAGETHMKNLFQDRGDPRQAYYTLGYFVCPLAGLATLSLRRSLQRQFHSIFSICSANTSCSCYYQIIPLTINRTSSYDCPCSYNCLGVAVGNRTIVLLYITIMDHWVVGGTKIRHCDFVLFWSWYLKGCLSDRSLMTGDAEAVNS